MSAATEAATDRYARWFEELTPGSLGEIGTHFAPDARFKDPFNDVRGHVAIEAVFRHMFETCSEVRFEVHGRAVQGRVAYLDWSFHFRLRRWRPATPRCISGLSRVRFDAQGRVAEHLDHWDAAEQVLEAVPLLGALVRGFRRRMQAPVPAAAGASRPAPD